MNIDKNYFLSSNFKQIDRLEIYDDDYFESVVKFAYQSNQLENLISRLKRLIRDDQEETSVFGSPGYLKVKLFKDFAPMSFQFAIMVKLSRDEDYKLLFNGGLIYHGKHDNFGDGSAPSFSVSMNNDQGWEIHT